ncbi:hypothetical protein AWC13_02685 [Mycobacterium kubicae]|nr:hypothetical protein AWC13_02685 [Mycobacterium kubicae]QNI14728.1 hypothetical protein GAN18_10390 [Mycobacterium kubicae]
MGGVPAGLTDSDVEHLAWEFLQSGYVGTTFANWSLDRRLDKFLRRRSLSRVADDGDLSNIVLDRIMTYLAGRSPLRAIRV